MKHKWKIAAVVVGAFVLVVAIPFLVNINTFKPIIENQLTMVLGRQVKLGDLGLWSFRAL